MECWACLEELLFEWSRYPEENAETGDVRDGFRAHSLLRLHLLHLVV